MALSLIVVLLGGFFAVLNWSALFVAKRTGRNVSVIPLIGGVLLAVGIYRLTDSIWLSLLAIVLDLGTLILFATIPLLIRQLWLSRS